MHARLFIRLQITDLKLDAVPEKFRCAAAKDAAKGLRSNAILANGQQQMPYMLAVGAYMH